jgi:hypothetical protein
MIAKGAHHGKRLVPEKLNFNTNPAERVGDGWSNASMKEGKTANELYY